MHIRLLLLGLFAWSGLSAQDAFNAELLFHWYDSEIPGSNVYDNAYNECWGMVQDGREYAVIGTTLGTHIFDVTEPETAYEAAFVEGAVTGGIIIHRDFHDYNGYLYAVADEGSSLQIIDITGLPDAVEVVYDSASTSSVHTTSSLTAMCCTCVVAIPPWTSTVWKTLRTPH